MAYFKRTLLYCFMLVGMLLDSCRFNAENKCTLLLQKANDNLYQFYISNDTLSLLMAKSYVDSIDCNSFKYKVFSIKITLFSLLNEYSAGIEYIKTLNTADFDKEYQKNMYLKSFEAMYWEAQGDTVKSNNLYIEIIANIKSYLNNNADQEALVDLFSIKSKIETKSEILKEIELLKETGKYDNDFLNALVEIQNDNIVESVAIPVKE
ncbi:MAG: hypothetical protein LBK94_07430 [Prevotellaceae bacterium]|nr:hypothetical protein [Prevotellaceae bacterium]